MHVKDRQYVYTLKRIIVSHNTIYTQLENILYPFSYCQYFNKFA